MRRQEYLLKVFTLILVSVYPGQGGYCEMVANQDDLYAEFEQLVQTKQKAKAIEVGQNLFERLISEHPENLSLQNLQRRLHAANSIAKLISNGLVSRQKQSLSNIIGTDILPELPSMRRHEKESDYLLLPAHQLYWSHLECFPDELSIDGFSTTESKFLHRYYDLRMQSWIKEVANNTKQVTVTNRESVGLLSYSIVLPLLYLSEKEPRWENLDYLYEIVGLDNLDTLSDFCLLRMERPNTAKAIKKYKSQLEGGNFSIVDWSLAASTKCVENHRPDLAEKLLSMAIDTIDDKDKVVEIKLKIAESYGKYGDTAAATERCKQIAIDFSDSLLYGKVISTYFAYLARQSKAQEILAEIEPALKSPQCQTYLPQLMYLKWWSLYKTNQQVLANQIGQKLIEDHGTNPCTAPVLLAQAIDALSNQHYEKCQKLLTQLVKNFPQTNSAKKAQKILARLNNK
jgi:tetratricopeptide (TPR) repeat protein